MNKVVLLVLLVSWIHALSIGARVKMFYKEAYTVKEASTCFADENCDGLRVCAHQVCAGISRNPKNQSYKYDESIKSSSCKSIIDYTTNQIATLSEYMCSGTRICIKNECKPYKPKDNLYYIEQQLRANCSNYYTWNADYTCDGLKTCVNGFCTGVARSPKDIYYSYKETGSCPKTSSDEGYQIKNYYCDGLRTCVNGVCSGTARPSKDVFYTYKGQSSCPQNALYSDDYVVNDYYCDGLQWCLQGKCQGDARPAKDATYQYAEKAAGCPTSAQDPHYEFRDYECDGLRKCNSAGKCEGTARPPKNVFYYIDPAKGGYGCLKNPSTSQLTVVDYYCDGAMTCDTSYGGCKGYARPPKGSNYQYDENLTSIRCPISTTDPGYPLRDYYCNGARTCSQWGWCQGTALLPKDAAYFFDESQTLKTCPEDTALNVALKDYFCDGMRTCLGGDCIGTARPPKSILYFYMENQLGAGCPGAASDPKDSVRDDFCDGLRTCGKSVCEGNARPLKDGDYKYDERLTSVRCPNPNDANALIKDYFCDGARTCSAWGWCQGTAR